MMKFLEVVIIPILSKKGKKYIYMRERVMWQNVYIESNVAECLCVYIYIFSKKEKIHKYI